MPLADTLLRLAEPPSLYQVRWTDEILEEVRRTLAQSFGKSREAVLYRESAMRQFFPGALVAGYEDLIAKMGNHPKDRHVLAAAVAWRADYLVTFNLKDFRPATDSVAVSGPSAFLTLLWASDPTLVRVRLREQAEDIGIPFDLLLQRLAKLVPSFVGLVRG